MADVAVMAGAAGDGVATAAGAAKVLRKVGDATGNNGGGDGIPGDTAYCNACNSHDVGVVARSFPVPKIIRASGSIPRTKLIFSCVLDFYRKKHWFSRSVMMTS